MAVSYVVKTLLLGAVWLMVPDFPEQAMSRARQAWSRLSGESAR